MLGASSICVTDMGKLIGVLTRIGLFRIEAQILEVLTVDMEESLEPSGDDVKAALEREARLRRADR